MKSFSVGKWLLLGGVLAFTCSCGCTQQDQARQPSRTAPSQDDDDDRDDGDMCLVPSGEQQEVSAAPTAEEPVLEMEQIAVVQMVEEPAVSNETVEAPAPAKESSSVESSITL